MSGGLIAFLNARLDEDERWAKALPSVDDITRAQDMGVISMAGAKALDVLANRERMVREVETNWAIVARCEQAIEDQGIVMEDGQEEVANDILRHLAAVYDGHPDYRQKWATT